MNHMKKLTLGSAVALAFGAGSVQAATVASQLFPGLNLLSDNSAEFLINAPGSAAGDTTVDVGDRLRGIFNIETVEDFAGGGGTRSLGLNSGNNQLAGIYDVMVVAKVDSGVPGVGQFSWVFVPTPLALSGFGGALNLDTGGFAAPTGTGFVFFEHSAPPGTYDRLDTCGTVGQGGGCEDLIAVGSDIFWYAGFTGATDPGTGITAPTGGEFFTTTGITDDITDIANTPAPGNGGQFNLGISQLAGGIGPALGLVPCQINAPTPNVNFCASGSLLGTLGFSTPFDSFDDVNFTINVPVPEPGSLALLGLGLGLGALVARRRIKV